MGYDLRSKNRTFRVNMTFYRRLLHLAYLFGWEPRGTEPARWEGVKDTDNSAWNGSYFTNSCYQTVIKEDAKEIAVSLQTALQYILDADKEENSEELVDVELFPEREEFNQMTEEVKDQFLSMFIGDKDYVKEFIDLCEDGGFCIS